MKCSSKFYKKKYLYRAITKLRQLGPTNRIIGNLDSDDDANKFIQGIQSDSKSDNIGFQLTFEFDYMTFFN